MAETDCTKRSMGRSSRGTQYQTHKKESSVKVEVKSEPSLDVPTPKPRGKGRGEHPKRSRWSPPTTTTQTLALFRTTKTSAKYSEKLATNPIKNILNENLHLISAAILNYNFS